MNTGKRIFGAFVLAAAVFAFFPVVLGGWARVSALKAAVAEREDLLAERTKVLADVDAQWAEYEQNITGEDGTKFTAIIPAAKDTAELVSAVSAIADGAGASIANLSFAEPKGKLSGNYRALTMSADVSGSYGALREFLSSLERYVRILHVKQIEVSSDDRNPGSLRFSITADAYFLK
jgi:Tfp pilus assembly protein PilO